ncbi:plant UBX domain-containing protein 8 isoform X1 [Neltuma alba]|uniref:plant UBX domain-containing protein 8 isoform X1 n=1 Tax=Neltuma alba TaxID=207710 RepID=UPI0010A2F57C|nr:plant UBX domain-containing protein 8-like isoform X1 [Prosopis alba]
MARPNQEAIETFISVTGSSEAIAVQKLEEHGGNLNEAINAHFSGDSNLSTSTHGTSAAVPQDDFMDIDNQINDELRRPLPLFSSDRNLNPFSLLDPAFSRSMFGARLDSTNNDPFVTHPREVREIPIEVKDGNQSNSQAGHAPTIEDVTGTVHAHGPDVHGTVIVDDDDDDKNTSPAPTGRQDEQKRMMLADTSRDRSTRPSAPELENVPDYGNDIEEEMIRAAIEASKREAEEKYSNDKSGTQRDLIESGPQQRQSFLEDPELAHAVSLSLKSAEQENARRVQGGDIAEMVSSKSSEVELGKIAASNGRMQAGSSSFRDEAEDVEEQPLVRNRPRRRSLGSTESANDVEVVDISPQSSTEHQDRNNQQHNGSSFHSDEWGGISSEEHDEAVMLEAAMFGGIPEESRFRFGYAPHEFMQSRGSYPRPAPRPPSPSLEAQRLIREQQDDEYLASLQADREKELKALEEAEAAREEEKRREEESRRKLREEQELETQLAAKEVSLPPEPSSDDQNAVTLLVRMPDGSRRGRRFLRSDNLQSLFDFIDVARVVKPGTYRLVRPYPRRPFSDGESASTLSELGLTNKQEALFLELI